MVAVTEAALAALADAKYGDLSVAGWGPRLRRRFGYYTPDDWYEATLCELIQPGTRWLDVGCGRDIFPSNPAAGQMLARRSGDLTGLDPDDNIDENPDLHHRAKATLEAYSPPHRYDVITLRMVVEHIVDAPGAAEALGRLCEPGGTVVIYTVNRWSPVSMLAAVTPTVFHHWLKRLVWGTEERDTFPTAYRMNTRRTLTRLMRGAGFEEAGFQMLADTRTTHPFRLLNTVELAAWRWLRRLGLGYPESCLLGLYRRLA